MSIPPLVCNTPPPPDQCEDGLDHDEYELQYNLSQDDEDEYDNGYDFQNYSTFNHFESHVKDKENVEKDVTRKLHPDITNKSEALDKSPTHSDNVIVTSTKTDLKCDKEIIEDLNLELDSDQSSASLKEIDKSKTDGSSEYSSDNATDLSTPDISVIRNIVETASANYESEFNLATLNESKPDTHLEVIEEPEIAEPKETFFNLAPPNVTESQEIASKNVEDDFDFDDYECQSTNASNHTTAIIDSCDNPWENNDACDDFGDFKANFDSGEDHQPLPETEPSMKKADEILDPDTKLGSNSKSRLGDKTDPDDDFGDFDDFQSSSNDNELEEPASQQQPLYNLSTDNEGQVIDSIHKVIVAMFEEDIEEPQTQFEGKLESMLCETWRYLLETDVRQPYMVNWNNSLGQKTLLKALSIDSRNILFGPKWSSNMPKYAANLCNAPLQPQKQPSASMEPNIPEKNASKTKGWSDPFKAGGQEFTYAEALLLDLEHLMATLDQMAHNNSSLKISDLLSHACSTENIDSRTENEPAVAAAIRPSDLDVFEAAITKKSEIHSAIIPMQPLRQINLPDTHIFTPSDSETPRSKTIHYDSGPPILLPQTLIDNTIVPEKQPVSNEESNEYWEFQDFKGASISSAPGATTLPNKNIVTSNPVQSVNQTYQTQLLQPIKVEPIAPTVHWPDPGEVKETFEDFSDFVTNSNWNNDKQNSLPTPQTQKVMHFDSDPKVFRNSIESNNKNIPNEVLHSNDSFDDEFDTFQSAALPSNSVPNKVNIGHHSNTKVTKVESPNTTPQVLPNTKIDFPLPGNKYDALSFMNTTSVTTTLNAAPNSSLSQDTFAPSISSKPSDFSVTNSPILISGPHKNNILQPTAASTQKHQKAGQILQPLSLESYSQINWPNPGLDFQDLSRFNPVETLQSLKNDLSGSKSGTPVHTRKSPAKTQVLDDDWGDFVSSKPKQTSQPKNLPVFVDDEEWTDFVSSPSVNPPNGLNTISLNVHTNLSMQMSSQNKAPVKNNTLPQDIPSLNYITPKSTSNKSYNDRHFQNL